MSDYIKRLAGPYYGEGDKTFTFGFFTYTKEDIYVGTSMSNDEATAILELDVDYTVSLNEDQDATPGGSITLLNETGLKKGEALVIGSSIDPTKTIQLTNYSRFPPEQIDKEFNRIFLILQQLYEITGRTLEVPATSSETPEEMIERLLAAQQTAQAAADAALDYKNQAQAILTQVEAYGDAVVTISPYAEYLSTIAGAIDDVSTVGENILSIQTVAGMEYSITTVAGLGSSLGTLAENVDVFEEVSEHSQAIQIVAADFKSAIACPNVHDFGVFGEDDVPSWQPTGGSISTVAGSINDVQIVADQNENITFIITHWDEIATAIGALGGTALLKENNLADVANVVTARMNLGLGTMATSNLDLGEWSEN